MDAKISRRNSFRSFASTSRKFSATPSLSVLKNIKHSESSQIDFSKKLFGGNNVRISTLISSKILDKIHNQKLGEVEKIRKTIKKLVKELRPEVFTTVQQ